MRYKDKPSGYDLYRSRYYITFYEDNDEDFVTMFDTIRELHKAVCSLKPFADRNRVAKELRRALSTETHRTILLGRPLRVYLIDALEDVEIDFEKN